MKTIASIFIYLLFLISVKAQVPPIGVIDFYGLQTLSQPQVQAALQIKEGDNLPASKDEVEKRLMALPNVEQARLGTICCDAGKVILWVGIKEKNAPTLQFRAAPKGEIRLPDEIVKTFNDFYEALKKATLKGEVEEDESEGHALMKNSEARAVQEKFVPLANQNLNLLRKVLHQSKEAEDRAIAAHVLGYYKDKAVIVKDLVYGINDPSGEVRNNSMRALGFIARYAQNHPEKKIKVPVKPFVDMLNSIEWTDRNKSSLALWQLTQKRDPVILLSLRQKALPALIEMSRWKLSGYALPGFTILARMANVPEVDIFPMWERGEREKVIELVQKGVIKKIRFF